ncbi:MAG: hypothetical protein K5770_02915 [Lachnospiraceae bacterium]|nr:hypothetical protein [Lachnospiraceae bacterium]
MIFTPPEDVAGIHFFSAENLEFSLALYSTNARDKAQIECLDPSLHTTESTIRWCENHNIRYDIAYPIKKLSLFLHPLKHIRFLKLISDIRKR